MTTTLCFLERMIGYQYVGRLQIVCKTSEKNGVHRRGWHVFRKIKTAETMQSPRQST